MSFNDSEFFNVQIENYNGPLDVLLDLAKAQKVNLEKISITKLADQFNDYIKNETNLNLETASEYLLMATWLAYLKSKLLLPSSPEEEFKLQEVAEKLKLQLKKLELIRLLSDQLLKRKRLGVDIRMRGFPGGIKLKNKSKYFVTLYELLKSYSNHVMRKNFKSINIPKLPVCTTEQAIEIIKNNIKSLNNWKEIFDLIPAKYKKTGRLRKSGVAGFFSASLELTKEGMISIMQKKSFDKLLIKQRK